MADFSESTGHPSPTAAGEPSATSAPDRAAGSPARDDQLLVIRIEGMHCHSCERRITDALGGFPGVEEVEVDFASGQASVLFDRRHVTVSQLVKAVGDAGYRTTGYIQNAAPGT
jgi:copper chaperone CopZ